jgi:hypothetical protein
MSFYREDINEEVVKLNTLQFENLFLYGIAVIDKESIN